MKVVHFGILWKVSVLSNLFSNALVYAIPFRGSQNYIPQKEMGKVIGHILICEVRLHFSWRNSPDRPRPPPYRSFMITLRHTTHLVGLLWTSDQPYSETSTWQHTTLTRERERERERDLCPRRDWNPPYTTP